MKTFTLLIAGLISVSAFAENTVQTNTDATHETGSARTYSVEVGFQALGDLGSQSAKTFSSTDSMSHYDRTYRITDGLLSVTLRKTFSPSFDLSLTMPVWGMVSNDISPGSNQLSFSVVDIFPASIGTRYHLSYFGDSIRPFVQADFGEAYIREYDTYSDGSGLLSISDDSRKSFRPFAKVQVGTDFAFAQNSPLYFGVKFGYLAISEFSSFSSGINLGYSF